MVFQHRQIVSDGKKPRTRGSTLSINKHKTFIKNSLPLNYNISHLRKVRYHPMKTVWKWILGIVIVLVVVAALVGGFVMMRNYRMTTFAQRYQQFSQRVPQSTNGTPAPKAPNGQTTPNVPANPSAPNRPMMGRGFGYGRGPMMNRTWSNDDGSRL